MPYDQQTPKTPVRVVLAIVGGLVGLSITFVVGAAILYMLALALEAIFGPYRVRRVGGKVVLALIIIPIAGAIWGMVLGWNFHQYKFGARLMTQLAIDVDSIWNRAWIAWAGFWTAAMIVMVATLGAFWRDSYYWYFERDALPTLLWWLGPIVGGFALSRTVAWVMRGSR